MLQNSEVWFLEGLQLISDMLDQDLGGCWYFLAEKVVHFTQLGDVILELGYGGDHLGVLTGEVETLYEDWRVGLLPNWRRKDIFHLCHGEINLSIYFKLFNDIKNINLLKFLKNTNLESKNLKIH